MRVSRLSFGTASLHHLYSSRARQNLLRVALDRGITHFDTSPYYGFGLAERDLGLVRGTYGGDMTIATKVGLYTPGYIPAFNLAVRMGKSLGKILPSISRAKVNWSLAVTEKSLDRSLKRLRTDRIDILFLHEPTPELLHTEEFFHWLQGQQFRGKLRYWGLAGNVGPMTTWLETDHPIAQILQVRDSFGRRDADLLRRYGRELQFTYGYFHMENESAQGPEAGAVLSEALRRNASGSVLFSTRRIERLDELWRSSAFTP